MSVYLVYVGGHDGLGLVLAKWDSRVLDSFPATLLAFSNVVSDCICSLPVCRSIRQSNRRRSRLAFFFKNLKDKHPQTVFCTVWWDSVPAGANMLHSATNQMAAPGPAAHVTSLVLQLDI